MRYIRPASEAVNCILQSFNAFDRRIANAPDQALNCTDDFRNSRWSESIVVKAPIQSYTGVFRESKSAEAEASNFSESVGIKGSYGIFSASVQYNSSTKITRSSTSFNSSTHCQICRGTVHLKTSTDILGYLDENLVQSLQSIRSLVDAEAFTKKYGTHVVTAVSLGGLFGITTSIETGSYTKLSKVSAEVSAKYGGALGSVELTAKVASEISRETSYGSVLQFTRAIGGDPIKAQGIDLRNPETLKAWAASCNEDAIFAVHDTKEYWALIEKTEASVLLRTYLNLVITAQSIKNPTIFSAIAPTQPFVENRATATVNEDYKIISGGANVKIGTSSFLCGSYPQYDDNKRINGWIAVSHDIATPSSQDDTITAYALAFYDPYDLFEVRMTEVTVGNQGIGMSKVEATLDPGYCLTGGGCSFFCKGNLKYIISSYPEGSSWRIAMSDYDRASENAEVTAYALGLAPSSKLRSEVSITKNVTKQTSSTALSHGNMNVSLSEGLRIAGGGVSLTAWNAGHGNLVQQCYPGMNNQWFEYNSDLNGSYSPVVATAYGINLTVECQNLSLLKA
ncbi:MAC/perforin domain-containing protein [Undibacterium fentianense]|uniref:MACPF domain-containing protein n=1 Tax=Undibacterium fentianense TaxID=2828728 RepID=A0A941E163_9BURK|nr:MAC/perforin domain-containing protein [Undibacterium fentianense]MBR7800480.1 hypothetical protein [Undibacterium fentianense]